MRDGFFAAGTRFSVLRIERTATAKAVRRRYGDNSGRCVFANLQLAPRPDGVSNTVSTVTKDNLLLVEYGL